MSWCVCVSLSAVEQDGKWGWRVAPLRQPRAVLGAASQGRAGCGMSCARTAPSRSSGCTGIPWETGLWDFQTGNPARIGLRVPHFGVCLGNCALVVAPEKRWVKWELRGFRGLAMFLKCVPVT